MSGGAIQTAAQLAGQIEAIAKAALAGGHWRLFGTLQIYYEARTTFNILDRLHQYCRCIDGLILPKAGETKRQFKSRTELFIGPRHHDLMGDMYDVRSELTDTSWPLAAPLPNGRDTNSCVVVQ
jgi:hypothetical protein